MKESLGDIVIDKLHERRRLVKGRLEQQYKKTKPFRMEPMSNEEALYAYNQLTPEGMSNLIQNYGEDAVNEMIFQMEKLKQKKGGG